MDTVAPGRVTRLWCPYPGGKRHPRWREIGARSVAWMAPFLESGSVDRIELASVSVGDLSSRSQPDSREEVVQFVSDTLMWLFALDDLLESDEYAVSSTRISPVIYRMQWALEGLVTGGGPEEPYSRALAELRRRIGTMAGALQVDRWVRAMQDWLSAVIVETAWRASGTKPGLDEYLLLRQRTGGGETVLTLLDIGSELPLSAEQWSHPQVRALTEMTMAVIHWHNDLFSCAKEMLLPYDDGLNLVSAFRTEYGVSAETAVEAAIRLCDRTIARCRSVSADVRGWAPPEVQAYLDGLEQNIAGQLAWAAASPRYRVTAREAFRPAGRGGVPSDASSRPPGIPAVDHWWQAPAGTPVSPVISVAEATGGWTA
ncbi:hypothetical protein [Lentzea sp. NPDC059081]|uniref:terpene synthase family protein n=1 Tax=Lentzea sp. NPDC059081 TaxID=3346719 RepID=UPI00369EE6BB